MDNVLYGRRNHFAGTDENPWCWNLESTPKKCVCIIPNKRFSDDADAYIKTS